eukprot:TRINITY_DN2291_c1_g1_i1.p1 TRINITY_DN2291_c1_g1~~TRINITY_DN2291_c1_g1_i1.p1  ORF type:complete len:447 (-),score=51.10 TRINITY_DN2291_c1_g1_i1:1520-2860(-)
MKDCLLFFLCLIITASALNPLPSEDWIAETIDLGNGGDKTFYILVKCKTCEEPPPFVLWLTGGPGVSTVSTLYLENGPYLFNTTTYGFDYNPYSWIKQVDVMYVDNPVGVPFSVAKNKSTLCKDEYCVARNLYTFLTKFVETHPEYKGRPLYLAGESYAGHYIPAFGKYLVKAANPSINFQGAGIGNGLINMYQQLPAYPEYLLMNKNISIWTYGLLKAWVGICEIARNYNIDMFDIPCTGSPFYVAELVGLKDPYDITHNNRSDEEPFKRFEQYINSTGVKEAFGTMDRNYSMSSPEVDAAMRKDWAYPLSDHIGYLLEHGKKVMLWFGDKDYVCNFVGGMTVAERIPWEGKERFRKAELRPWVDSDGKEIGQIKREGRLKYVKVYDGGHVIFLRQQAAGLNLVKELLKDEQVCEYTAKSQYQWVVCLMFINTQYSKKIIQMVNR